MSAYNSFRPEGSKPLFCYVPFNNISFSFKGRVLACAYNQKVELGKYPNQSIHDMWFSSEMGNSLRTHMEHNDLSYGCKHCKYFAEHRKFSGLKPLVFDKYHDYTKVRYPQVMEFELSSTCNFECVMCNGEVSSSIRKNRDQLPALKSPYDEAFVNQLDEFIPYLKEAKFYGGEPLLIPIYFKIWDRMLRLNPAIKIFTITNGSVMNQNVKDILERGNFDIAVSMDSTQKERLESIRKNVNKEQLLENIAYFNDYCKRRKKNLVISFTMMRINWQDFPDMIRFCNDQNAILYVSYLKTPPRFALWNLPAEELRQIREELVGEVFPRGTFVQNNNAQCFDDLLTYLQNAEQDALTRNPSEIISYSITRENPYSTTPIKLVNNQLSGTNSTTHRINVEYDSNTNYRALLHDKLLSENFSPEAFFVKIDKAMSLLSAGSDTNKVHFTLINSETKELVQSVAELSEGELLSRMQDVS
ncbi:MAG: radical SAM protein [Flavobacteriales bacterium]|nr:radical SAM protein [Flavobacteriales bacterium]